jgi:predicted patatin/cPLA2 family phospholipase
MMTPVYKIIQAFLVLFLMVWVSGCSSKPRMFNAPSQDKYTLATVPGYHNIRYWGDKTSQHVNETIERLKVNKAIHKRVDILALSGGAEDGAYGAGFLKGWSEHGDRPEFTLVTGISTGALIAPFAFLGPKYDNVIQRLYTETSQKNIFFFTPHTALMGGSALTDTAPLRQILKEEIDAEFVAKLAKESRKGRILHIGTTNLDAQRPVVWDITKIAQSGRSDAPELIRNVMLASASIPGVFPPVLIDVSIDGKRYQELHVDGGVTRQIFVYPYDLDVRYLQKRLKIYPRKTFWLIRNTKIAPEYSPVSLSVSDITERSLLTLIKYQGRGDLYNIEALSRRDGFNTYITNVPSDFDMELEEFFDRKYMNALYKLGYEKGRSGSAWERKLN